MLRSYSFSLRFFFVFLFPFFPFDISHDKFFWFQAQVLGLLTLSVYIYWNYETILKNGRPIRFAKRVYVMNIFVFLCVAMLILIMLIAISVVCNKLQCCECIKISLIQKPTESENLLLFLIFDRAKQLKPIFLEIVYPILTRPSSFWPFIERFLCCYVVAIHLFLSRIENDLSHVIWTCVCINIEKNLRHSLMSSNLE